MKQATLGFASKRVGSKAIIGKEKKGIVRAKFAPVARTKSPREVEEISDSEEEEEDDIVPIEIEEIQPDKDEEPLKKKKEIKKRRSLSLSPPKEDSAVANDKASQLKQEAEPDVPRADLDVHDPKWREPYARARERMGRVSPSKQHHSAKVEPCRSLITFHCSPRREAEQAPRDSSRIRSVSSDRFAAPKLYCS